MLVLRFQRIGKKRHPSYRIVVAERRSKLGAPPVEDLGSYSSISKVAALKDERIKHWIGIGAQPTITVHNLLVKHGVLQGKKRAVHITKKAGGETPAPGKEEATPTVAEAASPPAIEEAAPQG